MAAIIKSQIPSKNFKAAQVHAIRLPFPTENLLRLDALAGPAAHLSPENSANLEMHGGDGVPLA